MADREKPKPKRGRPTGTKRFSEDQVAAALRATGAVYSHAAIWLTKTYKRPCSRPAVHQYVNASPRLQELVAEINEIKLDFAEDMLDRHIEAGSERSLHFFLATKGKHRGYTRRDELTGPDGGPIETKPNYGAVTTEDLKNNIAALTEAARLLGEGGD